MLLFFHSHCLLEPQDHALRLAFQPAPCHPPQLRLARGRQPSNPAMLRRVLWYLAALALATRGHPCRRPPRILHSAVVFPLFGVWGGKTDEKITRRFFEVHFGHFLACVFFFLVLAKSQRCNLLCSCAFGMEKNILATCWKCRRWQKKHCKYHDFCYRRQKNIVNTLFLGFRGAKNIGTYGVFFSESVKKMRRHRLRDDF